LAKADPANANWQRDLAITHGRIGVVFMQQGEKEKALAELREGRRLIAAVLKKSPLNPQLPKDLAGFDAFIGQLEGKGAAPLAAKPAQAAR
jgi:hypothetical protein